MKKLVFLMAMAFQSFAQEVITLYPNGVPGSLGKSSTEKVEKDGIIRVSQVSDPTLALYIPKNKTSNSAVIICPGGGYGILAIEHEGEEIAKWFNERGMVAAVLKYRLPQPELFHNSKIRPLQDVQSAFRILRKRSKTLGIDKIGVMGFSAGGHLAATASTLFKEQVGEVVENSVSVRPDFSLLIYPVISLDADITHQGSKDNLIGKNPTAEDALTFSPEKQVGADTPPAFLVSTTDDWVVPENSIAYFLACKKNKVPVEMHIYEKGGHGYGLRKNNLGPVESWAQRMEDWLKSRGIL